MKKSYKIALGLGSIIPAFLFVKYIIAQLTLWLNGRGTVMIMIIVFSLTFMALDIVLSGFFRKRWFRSPIRISYWTTLVLLILAELVLRVTIDDSYKWDQEKDGKPIYYHSPQTEPKLWTRDSFDYRFTNKEFDYQHTINSLGLRDKEYTAEQLDSSYVILTLGDSFVEGVGVPDDSTWSRLLHQKLKTGRSDVICLNGGAMGSDIFYEYHKLKEVYYDAFKPDMVIAALNTTDLGEILRRGDLSRFDTGSDRVNLILPWWEKIYAISYMARYVIHDHLDYSTMFMREEEALVHHEEALHSVIDFVNEEYTQMANDLDFQLVIALTTLVVEWRDTVYTLDACVDPMTASGDVIVVNTSDRMFMSDIDFEKYYWPKDRHHNSRGHVFMANIIYDGIVDHVVSDGSE